MKCPFCGSTDDKVIDSRSIRGGEAIRRRRECLGCEKRFTSYEHIEQSELKIIKKDGRREPYDRNKIKLGIEKACEKRPVSVDKIEEIVDRIESTVCADKREVRTSEFGEEVMKELFKLDEVAYVRFASVYRQFKDVSEFMEAVKKLQVDLGVEPKE
ncbi:MAG: transcriptional regulator NrdR [bacterium]